MARRRRTDQAAEETDPASPREHSTGQQVEALVPREPIELHTREQAALLVGRTINHLHVQLAMAWLMGVENFAPPLNELWNALRLLVREVVEDPSTRDRLVGVVDQVRSEWEDRFGRLDHVDLLLSADAEAREESQGNSGRSIDEIIHRRRTFLRGVVDEFILIIFGQLDLVLTPGHREVLRLGILLDQVQHPLPPFRCRLSRQPAIAENSSWDAEVTQQPEREWVLPRQPIVQPENWPDVAWFQEFEQRWQQLGLSIDSLPRQSANPNAIETAGSVAAIVSNYENSLEAAIGDHNSEETGTNAPAVTGYLGLSLDDARSTVSRQGYETVVIQGLLRWNILNSLYQANGSRIRREDFSSEWGEINGTAINPSPTTIRSELSRLRREIRPLNLAIRVLRNAGYWLEDCSNDA